MVAACVRGLMFPMRWAVATLPRKSLVRSACVPVLKAVSHRPELMASLSEVRPLDRRDISFEPTTSFSEGLGKFAQWRRAQGHTSPA